MPLNLPFTVQAMLYVSILYLILAFIGWGVAQMTDPTIVPLSERLAGGR